MFNDNLLKAACSAKFRVLEAAVYLEKLSSDRSHMIDKRTGQWMKEPPAYPPIISSESPNN
ncbi:hypothetical protein LSTR_LSTR005992 [Laodelphax striatellus]|uniref:Protein N-terminal glutamine amidohydrolase n=1 Tax=Laodelphax striatellus TaxID=195883 RepID=A0A482XQM3_LAOST|nr:hypothetical protein LSTR_LSTR005992 [Laodelphax striatellus]